MNTFHTINKYICSFFIVAYTAVSPLSAASSTSDKISELVYSCPWVGLIAKEVSYGPVTISKVDIEKSGKLVFCTPGETISGTVHYKVDAAKFESWNLHHIIVGLRDQDAQNCILHSLGVCDDHGKASFNFVAPLEKGIYELCFDYHRAMFCSKAIEEWHAHSPAQKTTIGIVVVE